MIKHNYKLPPSYHLGGLGCGCAGEPPGHPRYFVRSIYTRHGNSPGRGPQYWLDGICFDTIEDVDKLYGTTRYPKLPLDHPRTRGWILDKYRHHNHCYYHPTEKEYNRRATIIFPVPGYKLELPFKDHEGYSEEYRAKQRAAIDQRNQDIKAEAAKICIPENHQAVVLIREYYPEYEPELDLIENPPKGCENWWERLAEKPTPEQCPGEPWRKHPVNGTWCQVCGWHEEKGADNK